MDRSGSLTSLLRVGGSGIPHFLGSPAPLAKGNPTGDEDTQCLPEGEGGLDQGQAGEALHRGRPGNRVERRFLGGGSAEQAEGHQAELQKRREGLQGPGAGTTEDLLCGEAESGLGVGDEEWRLPNTPKWQRGLGAGSDDSLVS